MERSGEEQAMGISACVCVRDGECPNKAGRMEITKYRRAAFSPLADLRRMSVHVRVCVAVWLCGCVCGATTHLPF